MKLCAIIAFAAVGCLLAIGCEGSPFFDKIMEKGKEMMSQGPWGDIATQIEQAIQQGGGGAAEKMKESLEQAMQKMGQAGEQFKGQMEQFAQMAQEQMGQDPTQAMKQMAQEMAKKMEEVKNSMGG